MRPTFFYPVDNEIVEAAVSVIDPNALMDGMDVPMPSDTLATPEFVGSFMPWEPSTQRVERAGEGESDRQGPSLAAARSMLMVVAAVYGTNFGCIKLMEEQLPCSAAMASRFAVATLFLLPACVKAPPKVVLAGFETGLWCAVGYLAQALSLQGIGGVAQDAGKSGFICALVCLVVPILDAMIGKMPSRRTWIAAAAATLGIGLLELGDAAPVPGAGGVVSVSTSDLVSLLQPIGFGLGFWRMETFSRKFPEGALPLAAGQILSTGILSTGWALSEAGFMGVSGFMDINTNLGGPGTLDGTSVDGVATLSGWVSTIVASPVLLGTIMWTGVATTALTVLGETMALRTLSATETTLIFSTEPLWAAAFANMVLGETMGPSAAAGGALIVAACAWSALGGDSGPADIEIEARPRAIAEGSAPEAAVACALEARYRAD